MRLQELIKGILVDIVFVLLQKLSEIQFIFSDRNHVELFCFRCMVNALADLRFNLILKFNVNFVNVSQFQLSNPSTE
jgi:hypothetical protein